LHGNIQELPSRPADDEGKKSDRDLSTEALKAAVDPLDAVTPMTSAESVTAPDAGINATTARLSPYVSFFSNFF